MNWQAEIWYHHDEEAVRGEAEFIIGPLRSLECFIRSREQQIRLVELTPAR